MYSLLLVALFSLNAVAANVILKTVHPSKKMPSNMITDSQNRSIVVPSDGHIVKDGDTLFGIARMYGTSHVKIMEANNMKSDDVIKIGQKLKIPQNSVVNNKSNRDSTNQKVLEKKTDDKKTTPQNGIHIVDSGETLFGIARMYSVSPIDLATDNNIDLAYMVKVGQKIKIPSAPTYSVQNLNKEQITQTQETQVQSVQNLKVRNKLNEKKINCDLGFSWPVHSTQILHGYGETLKNGTKTDGVVVFSELNKNIVSAYAGEVAYAGNDIPEYGNLMIIKHQDNWMTIYGYMNTFARKVGDKVTKGDLIGTVGQTGEANGSALYFSIRKVKTPYNPELCI